MHNESCQQITELLLPYSDGELSADDCGRVEAHLAACPECRRELSLLTRSLDLARTIWQESAAAALVHPVTPSPRHPLIPSPAAKRQARRRAATLAGVAALALLAVGTWLIWPPDRGNQVTYQAPVTPSPPRPVTASSTPSAPEEIDVEAYVAREGRKARLQASIAILATEPSLKEYKERAERYLFEAYPETAPGGQPTPAVEYRNEEPKS